MGLMYSATESFRLWHRTDFQQDVAEERQEENKYHRMSMVFLDIQSTSLQLFAILYKIYMAQNENKCYSIWVKYIWKILSYIGKTMVYYKTNV